ncbi:uncharacterized protein LOC114716182 [Neltuma alba]|uniref:uncharacterized protein LOC114716182 n=1 Tax=Neltuma alba TaxID=207710 RepID=UPI0010A4F587|nr:uncharacterized protein LOC114716182 [Prosopis alba]
MLSDSKEHDSNRATDGAYESDSQNNSSCSCIDDIVNSVLPSSEGKEGGFCQTVLLNPDSGFSLGSKVSVSSNGMDVSLNSQLSPDLIPSATAVCIPNFDNAVQIHEANESGGMDASLNSQLPPDPAPNETAVCLPNCDDAVPIHDANESSGLDRLATFSSPFSEDRTAEGATGFLLEKEVPIETIGTVFLTDSPKNAIPPKPPSSIQQRFDEGASNVSDGELLLRPFGTAGPSHGSDIIYDTNSLSPEQQPLGEIPTEVLENSHGENECCNDKENQTDVIMLDNIASLDQQEGISRTINEDSVSQEIPVSCSQSEQPLVISSPVPAVNEVPQDFRTSLFASNKIADEDVRVGEVHYSSQQAERSSGLVDDVAIQSNPESLAMETTVQVQLSSAKFPFSSQDATEKMLNASQQAESVSTPFSTVPVTLTNPDLLLVNSPEQVQILHSAEFPLSNQDLAEEVEKFSQEVEPLSNPVSLVLPNQSNSESLVMEPLMQEQHLPTSEFPSSNHDIVEEMHNPSQQDRQVMANQDLVKGLPSAEHPSSNENTAEELQSSSQQIGSVCCPIDYTPHARANGEIRVMGPLEHAQQLLSVRLPSSNLHRAILPLAPTAEDQRINEITVSSHVPQAIDEVPNQVVMQLDSMTPTGGRTHFSNTINRSTPGMSSQPIQTATRSASRIPPPLYVDPLEIEMEKIRKETYQAVGDHEKVKLQLKSDREKEMKEIVRKYNMKLQEMEVEYQQKKKSLNANMKKTLAEMKLAEVIRSKCWGPKLIGATGMPIDANFAQQFVQFHGEQSAVRPSLVGSSSCMRPATTLQSSFAMVRSQLVATPIQSSYGTTGNFSNVSARTPQVVGNMHTFAPCPQLYGSLTSMPTTSHVSHPTPLSGTSSRLVPSTIPATPFSLPYILPQPTPPPYQQLFRKGISSPAAALESFQGGKGGANLDSSCRSSSSPPHLAICDQIAEISSPSSKSQIRAVNPNKIGSMASPHH